MSQIFANGNDDYMFPTSQAGLRECGMILESANVQGNTGKTGVLENSVDEYSEASRRIEAMSAVLAWFEEGDYTYTSLDETVIAVADLDGDFEITEAEEIMYADIWNEVPNALLTLGADKSDVQELIDGPGEVADKAAARIGKDISEKLEKEEADDNSLIAGFAFGEEAILESVSHDASLHGILEATYKRTKVFRQGQMEVINKRTSGHVQQSAAQRAVLKKARRKAHNAAAELQRQKTMKVRKQHGM